MIDDRHSRHYTVFNGSEIFSERLVPDWDWTEIKPGLFTVTADCVRYYVQQRYHTLNRQYVWAAFAVPSSHTWSYHGFMPPSSPDHFYNEATTVHELVQRSLQDSCLVHTAAGFEHLAAGCRAGESHVVCHDDLHPIAQANELLQLLGTVELRHSMLTYASDELVEHTSPSPFQPLHMPI